MAAALFVGCARGCRQVLKVHQSHIKRLYVLLDHSAEVGNLHCWIIKLASALGQLRQLLKILSSGMDALPYMSGALCKLRLLLYCAGRCSRVPKTCISNPSS